MIRPGGLLSEVKGYEGLLGGSVVKSSPANAGNIRGAGSIPRPGRFPGARHGNSLQYSCLKNPMDREAWQTTVHGVGNSRTGLKQLSTKGYDVQETESLKSAVFSLKDYGKRTVTEDRSRK